MVTWLQNVPHSYVPDEAARQVDPQQQLLEENIVYVSL